MPIWHRTERGNMRSVGLCFAVGLLAIPLAHASAADCALKKLASFDATFRSGALLVKAQIDDQPVSVMLDTGARYNMLNKVTVDLLKLPTQPVPEGMLIDATG